MTDVLKLLIAERDRLDRAIAVLQGTAPRRGRPAGSGRKKAALGAPRERRPMSAAARKRLSERMTVYWAKKRRAGKK